MSMEMSSLSNNFQTGHFSLLEKSFRKFAQKRVIPFFFEENWQTTKKTHFEEPRMICTDLKSWKIKNDVVFVQSSHAIYELEEPHEEYNQLYR